MSNLSFPIPFPSVCLSVFSFASCGIPFVAGFCSKELILEIVSLSYINLIGFSAIFCFFWLTVCYSLRLFYVFCGDFNLRQTGRQESVHKV
jgi:NADH-ubiquinone oxidoreductase chain 5